MVKDRGLQIVKRKDVYEPKKQPAPNLTKLESFVANLSIESLMTEYNLINKKQSKLPSAARFVVKCRVVFLVEEGVIKIKAKEEEPFKEETTDSIRKRIDLAKENHIWGGGRSQ